MPKKMCVIGATDIIGYYVSNRLAITGNLVKAISTDSEMLVKKNYHPDIEKYSVTHYSPETLGELLNEVQVCLVYNNNWNNQSEFTKNIIDSVRKKEISHIVYISIMGAGSERMEAIGREYDEAEYTIENSGIGWTILRHNFLMQDLLTCMEQATSNFCFPTGREHVSFIDARDVAVSAAEVMVSGFHFHGKTYTLTGSESYSFKQCADILSKVSGTTLHYDNCDQEFLRSIFETKNVNKSVFDFFLSWSRYAGSGLASVITKDVELVAGIESTAFEDFARDNAESIREFLSNGRFSEDVL